MEVTASGEGALRESMVAASPMLSGTGAVEEENIVTERACPSCRSAPSAFLISVAEVKRSAGSRARARWTSAARSGDTPGAASRSGRAGTVQIWTSTPLTSESWCGELPLKSS